MAEFVDELDGRLTDERRAHLESCVRCAEQTAALRSAVTDAQHVESSEPSPLFWDHFSARVRAALRDTTPARLHWWRHPAFTIACSLVLVAAVLTGVRDSRVRRAERAPLPAPPAAAVSASEVPPADDAAWNLLTDVASTMEEEDPHAAPLAVRPAEVDRAVVDLSATERQELRRLLQNELKRSGN
ncbi:MAG TPA: hypothetical protein VL484_05005 [Vicinamibacterales bacterium]|nr:hypothetical protein [Vicinamibacterales bacterium]